MWPFFLLAMLGFLAIGFISLFQNRTMSTLGDASIITPGPTMLPTLTAVTAELPTLTLMPTFVNPEGTPNTPTPDLHIVIKPTIESPPTALPKGKIVDLTNGTPVPAEQMVIFTVERVSGVYDEYHIPPWLLQNATTAYSNQWMEIKPGDKLLGWLAGHGSNQPLLATETIPVPLSTKTP